MPLKDHPQLAQLVAPILDEAITTTAQKEFNRLREATNDDALVAEKVTKAVVSLAILPYGTTPEYNEWDALLHITYYHPQEINVAIQILDRLCVESPEGLGREAPLHIVDVGCAALAVQIALAIAATVNQLDANAIDLKLISATPSLMKIGTKLWNEFRSLLDQNPELSDLSRACEDLSPRCEFFDSYAEFWSSDVGDLPSECWLTSLPPEFNSNRKEIIEALKTLHQRYTSKITYLTCHELQFELARCVPGVKFDWIPQRTEKRPFDGKILKTSKWREELVDVVSALREEPMESNPAGLLKIPVRWIPYNMYRGYFTMIGKR